MIALVFVAAGHPWLFLFLWVAPWMTVWRVLNRLRAIAEHGGMTQSSDRRQTTHHVRQGFWARFWIAPYNTGWHLAHHVDIGDPVPSPSGVPRGTGGVGLGARRLKYKSYTSLWKALGSRTRAEVVTSPR